MADTLVELVKQGDPGTAATEEQAASMKLLGYEELYDLWERQPWQVQELDFSKDREDWLAADEEDKEKFLFGFSVFFTGEQRVTAELAPIAFAAPTMEQQVFLSTQMVDEARHHVFFDRFYREVIGLNDSSMRERLEAIHSELNEGFIELFDVKLHEYVDDLRRNPENLDSMVRAVTTYHMVVEGTLALTGQHFITEYLEGAGILPGYIEGFKKVARDEHRHVAFGTCWLRDMAEESDHYKEIVQQTLAELVPIAAQVLVPKGVEDPYNWEMFGYTSEQINEFAFKALSRRLKAMRIPLPGVG